MNIGEIRRVAQLIAQLRTYNLTTAQAELLLLAAAQLGLNILEATEYLQFVGGRLTLTPRGALALAWRSGVLADLKIEELTDPIGVRVTLTRADGKTITKGFTLADAERAGLVKPGSGWEKYPAQMCQWRAIGFALDALMPHVVAGTAGLKLAMDEGERAGLPVAAESPALPEPPKALPEPSPLDRLIARVGETRAVALLEQHGGDVVAAMAATDAGGGEE
ncbi:MAG: hypothetical protein KatS3mg059_1793 [Thermomicrobiales bacterium]|nr:MAG: hypothetical protein KatS3mg059_1793 [Thermomicrobiales bacterium]